MPEPQIPREEMLIDRMVRYLQSNPSKLVSPVNTSPVYCLTMAIEVLRNYFGTTDNLIHKAIRRFYPEAIEHTAPENLLQLGFELTDKEKQLLPVYYKALNGVPLSAEEKRLQRMPLSKKLDYITSSRKVLQYFTPKDIKPFDGINYDLNENAIEFDMGEKPLQSFYSDILKFSKDDSELIIDAFDHDSANEYDDDFYDFYLKKLGMESIYENLGQFINEDVRVYIRVMADEIGVEMDFDENHTYFVYNFFKDHYPDCLVLLHAFATSTILSLVDRGLYAVQSYLWDLPFKADRGYIEINRRKLIRLTEDHPDIRNFAGLSRLDLKDDIAILWDVFKVKYDDYIDAKYNNHQLGVDLMNYINSTLLPKARYSAAAELRRLLSDLKFKKWKVNEWQYTNNDRCLIIKEIDYGRRRLKIEFIFNSDQDKTLNRDGWINFSSLANYVQQVDFIGESRIIKKRDLF